MPLHAFFTAGSDFAAGIGNRVNISSAMTATARDVMECFCI
jgi:hypothetical protein